MADKRCVNHGGDSMLNWDCPICAAAKEQRKIQEEAHERAKELADQQSRGREEYQQKLDETLERDREERERALEEDRFAEEEAQYRREEALRKSEERQRENLANRYKLESESKSVQASKLLKAGLTQDSIDLAKSAVLQDPSNIYAHLIIGEGMSELGKIDDAKSAFKKSLLLLRMSDWNDDASVHLAAFRSVYHRFDELKNEVVSIIQENADRMAPNKDTLKLIRDLLEKQRINEAIRVFSGVIQKHKIGGNEWWQAYFDILSPMIIKGYSKKDIDNFIGQRLEKSWSNSEANELLILMLFAAKTNSLLVINSLSKIPHTDSNRILDAFRELKSGNYGAYKISCDFSMGAIPAVEGNIRDVNDKVWKLAAIEQEKNNELSIRNNELERLRKERDAVTAGGLGLLTGFLGLIFAQKLCESFYPSVVDMSFIQGLSAFVMYIGGIYGGVLVARTIKKSLKNTHIQNLESTIGNIRNEKWVGQGISQEEYLSNKRKADEKAAKNVVFIKRALKIAGILLLLLILYQCGANFISRVRLF